MFELGVQHTSNNSVISGYVGNAASSSGSLGCERSTVTTPEFPDGVPTLGCRVYFALTDGDGNPVPTTLTDAHNSNRPSGAVSPDGPTSYILSRNPKDGDGLPPGQVPAHDRRRRVPACDDLDRRPAQRCRNRPAGRPVPREQHRRAREHDRPDQRRRSRHAGHRAELRRRRPDRVRSERTDQANFSCDRSRSRCPPGGSARPTSPACSRSARPSGAPNPGTA